MSERTPYWSRDKQGPEQAGPTEMVVEYTRVMGPNTMGCQRFHRDVMLVLQDAHRTEEGPRIWDVFLTKQQAEELHAQLGERIAALRDGDDE